MRTKIKNEYINVSKEEIKRILLGESSLSNLAQNYLKMNPQLSSFNDEEKKLFKELYPEIFL